jgi:hypothetical protein
MIRDLECSSSGFTQKKKILKMELGKSGFQQFKKLNSDFGSKIQTQFQSGFG